MKRYGLWVMFGSALLISACSGGGRDDDGATDSGPQTTVDAGNSNPLDGAVGDGGASTPVDASGMDARLGEGGTGEAGSPFAFNDAGQVLCGNSTCACSDGIDQDTDGLIDQADPECVSGWDNDESSFATGISGDNRDEACQDCFFDGNSGSGNDGCRVPSSCLTLGNASSGQGGCNSCTVSDRCKNFCQAYTPNGCDCFGCCGVQLGSNIVKNVLLSGTCSIDGDNLSNCTECVPSVSCVNTCGRCELCPGKTVADLPADCGTTTTADGGVTGDGGLTGVSDGGVSVPSPTCDFGEARCGVGLPACAFGSSCNFGCCLLTPLL